MNEPFFEVIKKIIYRKRISQNELARRVGSNTSSMSHYLNGLSEMPLSIAVAIAKELHIDLNGIYEIDADRVVIDEIEEELLEIIRSIPPKNRRAVVKSIKNLIHSLEEK